MTAPEYLRAPQIATLLGNTERTVRRWIADGTLPSVKLGGSRFVARADLYKQLGVPARAASKDGEIST